MLRRFAFWVYQCRLWWHQLNETDLRGTAAMARQTARECEQELEVVTAQQIELKQRMNQLDARIQPN